MKQKKKNNSLAMKNDWAKFSAKFFEPKFTELLFYFFFLVRYMLRSFFFLSLFIIFYFFPKHSKKKNKNTCNCNSHSSSSNIVIFKIDTVLLVNCKTKKTKQKEEKSEIIFVVIGLSCSESHLFSARFDFYFRQQTNKKKNFF